VTAPTPDDLRLAAEELHDEVGYRDDHPVVVWLRQQAERPPAEVPEDQRSDGGHYEFVVSLASLHQAERRSGPVQVPEGDDLASWADDQIGDEVSAWWETVTADGEPEER
jgi:hypothetical protein